MDETLFGSLLGCVGLVGLLWRRDLLGVFLSVQLMATGLASSFLRLHTESAKRAESELAAVLVFLGISVSLAVGFALAVRLFYKSNRTTLEPFFKSRNADKT